MTMCYLISMKSKNKRTRVGAVIVGPDNEIRSSGYNGLPRGYADLKERYDDREHKSLTCNHAEENSILHCAANGVSTKGCRLYVMWKPCARCAKAVIQAGIVEVIYHSFYPGNKPDKQRDWEYSVDVGVSMFKEVGVTLREYSGGIIKIEGLYDGEGFYLPEAVCK